MGVEGEGLAGGVGGRGSEGGLGFEVEACGEGGVRGGAEDEDAYVWVGGGVADDVCEFCPHVIVEGVYRRPVELEEQHAGCGGGGCV